MERLRSERSVKMIPKFRAWDCDVRKMTNWKDLILDKSEGEEYISIGYKESPSTISFDHEMILMQSTGLKDKNGTEIYEGDVVKNISTGSIGVVVWDIYKVGFMRKVKQKKETSLFDYFSLYSINGNNMEVIGNIYENMELLEVY